MDDLGGPNGDGFCNGADKLGVQKTIQACTHLQMTP